VRQSTARDFLKSALHARRSIPKRLKRQAKPLRFEIVYLKFILSLLSKYKDAMQSRLHIAIPNILERAKERLRHDAESDAIEELFEQLEVYIGTIFDPDSLKEWLFSLADDVGDFNADQLNDQLRSVIGVDVVGAEPWLEERLSAFAAENASLITTIPERLHDEVAQATIRAIREGQSTDELADTIEERFGVAETRAAFIARDQIGGLNAEIAQERQTGLGIKTFIWRTSEDARVRPEHAERDGQEYSWDDPPDDEIPGQPINCRCLAEAVLASAVDEDE
jgi:SPP1 gp7 family putative phage head morphogenesis protein